jgi:hypothetical protein
MQVGESLLIGLGRDLLACVDFASAYGTCLLLPAIQLKICLVCVDLNRGRGRLARSLCVYMHQDSNGRRRFDKLKE